MTTLDVIKSCTLFSGLERAALSDLAALAVRRNLEPHEVLFQEGDAAQALFFLLKGDLELVKSAADGRERFLRRVKPGEVFAEAAMFAGEGYPATARARLRSQILAITRSDFLQYISQHPAVSLSILGAMARLLRHLNGMLAELSLNSVEARLAAWILQRARHKGKPQFMLGITKKELAFRLGTVPETLSRNLAKLVKRGAIRVSGEKIEIRDGEKLEASIDG